MLMSPTEKLCVQGRVLFFWQVVMHASLASGALEP